MKHTLPALLLSVIFALTSCQSEESGVAPIYEAEGIEVYADSIIVKGHEFVAHSPEEITNSWKRVNEAHTMSLSTGSKLADAFFAKALDDEAQADVCSTTDAFLAGAFLHPEKAMESLRSQVVDGRVHRAGYPVTYANAAWGAAAWEVYCATGEEEWLREAYNIIMASLRADYKLSRGTDGLLRGASEFLVPAADFYPSWMQPVDRYLSESLTVNAFHVRTLEVASLMAAELHLYAENELRMQAAEHRQKVNNHFWIPSRGYYGQYRYGQFTPILSPAPDNVGNPLCVLFSIAIPEMGSRLMEARQGLPLGMPLVAPSPTGNPRFMALTQALQGLAAVATKNEDALLHATSSLWALSLLSAPVAEWPALVVRGYFGMSFSPEGIEFAPFIPEAFQAPKHLRNFAYREATLDINIYGYGDKVASFAIDSVASHPRIPATLKGHHTIDIVMASNTIDHRKFTVGSELEMPAMPRLYWSDPFRATVLNHQEGMAYEVWVNGVLLDVTEKDEISLDRKVPTIVDIVPSTTEEPRVAGFSPAAHVSAQPTDVIHVPATSITPRRPPIHRIKNPKLASKYIELSPRHNARLTFYVNAPSAGDYYLLISYSNGLNEPAVREVGVGENLEPAGTILCLPVTFSNWVSVRNSSWIKVSLDEGPNKLALTYVSGTILLNDIILIKK